MYYQRCADIGERNWRLLSEASECDALQINQETGSPKTNFQKETQDKLSKIKMNKNVFSSLLLVFPTYRDTIFFLFSKPLLD